jgi:hypothetical protein
MGDGLVFFREDIGRVLKGLFALFGEDTCAGLAAQGDVPVFGVLFRLGEGFFLGALAVLLAVHGG